MKTYMYKNQIWLYKQDNVWKRLKREFIIFIKFNLIAIPIFILLFWIATIK